MIESFSKIYMLCADSICAMMFPPADTTLTFRTVPKKSSIDSMDIEHLTGSPTSSPLQSQFSSLKDTDLYKIRCREAISPVQSSLHEVNQRVVLHGSIESSIVLQQKSVGEKFKYLTPESGDVNKQRECYDPLEGMGLSYQDKSQVTNASCSQLASREMEVLSESTPISGAKRSSPVSSPRQSSNKRLRNTPQKWNEHRSRIQTLYIDQGKSLTETMKSLEEENGFKASCVASLIK